MGNLGLQEPGKSKKAKGKTAILRRRHVKKKNTKSASEPKENSGNIECLMGQRGNGERGNKQEQKYEPRSKRQNFRKEGSPFGITGITPKV